MNDWIIYGAYYIFNFFSYIFKLLEDCFEKYVSERYFTIFQFIAYQRSNQTRF